VWKGLLQGFFNDLEALEKRAQELNRNVTEHTRLVTLTEQILGAIDALMESSPEYKEKYKDSFREYYPSILALINSTSPDYNAKTLKDFMDASIEQAARNEPFQEVSQKADSNRTRVNLDCRKILAFITTTNTAMA
jgi:hypothetical protein